MQYDLVHFFQLLLVTCGVVAVAFHVIVPSFSDVTLSSA